MSNLPKSGRRALGALAALSAVAFAAPARAVSLPDPGALSASTLRLPDGPASIRGLDTSASVDIFGSQVAYGVPFDVPAGVAGLRPKLGLVYSGALGSGPI